MLKKIGKRLKDQRGLTLVELLAVVVILGIIAIFAVPSIGGIIDNAKKDAHIANAQQMVNSARLGISSNEFTVPAAGLDIKLEDLIKKGFIEPIKDPSDKSKTYPEATTLVKVTKDATTGNYTFKVVIPGHITDTKEVNNLERSDVTL